MNRTRMLIAVVVAIAIGAIASTFVYQQIKNAAASVVQVRPVKTTPVVVAIAPIPLGTRLEDRHLQTIDWPASAPMQGMFTRPEDCIGRAVIVPLIENEPVLENNLAPLGSGAGLSATIPEGMRALSVKVNEVIAVAGFVIPGTMVDVLVTGEIRSSRGNSITKTFLENIRVLAAGQTIEKDEEGKPQVVPVVTLLVTPDDATKLTMASTMGKIQLSLRNTIDQKKNKPAPVFHASLFSGGTRRRPGRRGPKAFAVEVIRGNQRTVSTFANP